MRLAKDRFYQSTTQFKCADGEVSPATVYTYETHNALYDIVVIRGQRFARKNCGPLRFTINYWEPVHYEIERHFGLDVAA